MEDWWDKPRFPEGWLGFHRLQKIWTLTQFLTVALPNLYALLSARHGQSVSMTLRCSRHTVVGVVTVTSADGQTRYCREQTASAAATLLELEKLLYTGNRWRPGKYPVKVDR